MERSQLSLFFSPAKMTGYLMEVLLVFGLALLHSSASGLTTQVSYDASAIIINGERRVLFSGSIHYPRSTVEYDFSGNLDFIRFFKTIQEAGLYAIIRIGPYVCAEWNYGGFPMWLHNLPGIELQTDNEVYKNEMQKFTAKIVEMCKEAKLLGPQGGPIILAQIENEYRNIMEPYGEAGKSYIKWCAQMALSLNAGVPWIMCQQDDAPQTMINTCNGFYCDDWKPNNPKSPKMWTENWTGWYGEICILVRVRSNPIGLLKILHSQLLASLKKAASSLITIWLYHGEQTLDVLREGHILQRHMIMMHHLMNMSTGKDILVQQGLLKPLLGNKPESMDQDDWEELQAKAVSTIRYENKNGHGRGRGRSRSRNSGHGKDRSKSRGKQDKSSIECWYCKEIGHIARRCPERKEKKNGKKHVNNANVAEEDDKSSDGDLYLVSSVEQQEGNLLSVKDNSFSTEWFLDSACSFHMCPHKEWFDCLTPCDGGTVLMGNDDVCKVMGIGTIKIKMFDGIVRTLGDVRYIPDLKKNLISLGTLDSIDCSISIKGGVMKVSKGAMVIMKGQKIGNLYKLIGNTVIGGASVSTHVGSSNDNSELWHKRLGHLSEGALHEQRTKSTDESTDGSTDEQSLEDPEEHSSDSWNLVRDREPRTKKPTQSCTGEKVCFLRSEWGKGSGTYNFTFEKNVTLKAGANTISLLSATLGLKASNHLPILLIEATNYGAFFDLAPTGIVGGPVQLIGNSNATMDLSSNQWSYKVGLNGEALQLFGENTPRKIRWTSEGLPILRPMTWHKTTFKAPLGADPVVVDIQGMGKGHAWVNAHSIGRFWPSFLAPSDGCSDTCDYRGTYKSGKCLTNCGKPSQRWYHVQRSFLRDDAKTLVLFEEIGGNPSQISFQTVTVGSAWGNVYEGSTLELSCLGGKTISEIQFASFGDPQGTCGSFKKGSCEAVNALSVVQKACIGKESCTIDVSEATFGPSNCGNNITKRLAVQAVC
ncbi:hypothetical protein RJ640_014159 [Escallonia rubra]|uniref:Beta-galactosidase n=1 Tax=Escallonia rubra TaxID=112253 RepID=A0AA88QRW6_9ASTE|nr:hypothetical protein RJ640_014159 [Escallonia rubra]